LLETISTFTDSFMQQRIKKIVVIGPESTGKSTLSKALAEKLNTVWVAEYARTYLDAQNNQYDFADLKTIAQGQIEAETLAETTAHQFLICDTDLYVLKVWSEHKYNQVDAFILEQIAERHYDAYILCNIDMAWVADPQREHPNPAMRQYFFHMYKDIVSQSGRPFIIVSGNEAERVQQALATDWFDLG
jgi:NadR type nicotinamide-nucleotide adenylyltransferase